MAPALTLPSPPPELEDFPSEAEKFHVLDLPAMYTKPSAISLLKSLARLILPPPSWDSPADTPIDPPGLTKWLTSIIASPLHWIAHEDTQEQIWESASARLAERCGRTAMPSTTRTFRIPLPSSENLELTIHEPTLTADNLGLKTWASSYLLSKRLGQLLLSSFAPDARALELGSGTGLVGLAAAGTWGIPVLLTDLPEIVLNLQRNVDANRAVLKSEVDVTVLDWRDKTGGKKETEKFDVVLAADPIYSPEHPALVAGMVGVWMKKGSEARAVMEMPLRTGFEGEREGFKKCMSAEGLEVIEQGVETGFDDWENGEVRCWWSVWGWARDV